MIITNIIGGLGNQIFQYAFHLYLKRNLPEQTHFLNICDFENYTLHSGYLLEKVFDIKEQYTDKVYLERFKKDNLIKRIGNKTGMTKNQIIFDNKFEGIGQLSGGKNYLFHGYWQNKTYVESLQQTLNEKLKFNIEPDTEEKKIMELMEQSVSVSLHIRRGDYLSPENKTKFSGICTDDYYSRAIKYFTQKYPHVLFFVFSDDEVYVKKNYNGMTNFYIMKKHEKDYHDMFLMSKCRHNIIANSSFSWWAAWLNKNPQKEIICPSEWFNIEDISQKILQDKWIKISRNGEIK